ncbi:MAG: tRNA (adenosine(37)-N6)-threonylcarbamoyltransferase complex ATPase subunit type 1 TsaE [Candidatus Omnitrophica bacterium]|nr:tRNA (adenosine(37)-N6)-threonylcarbamoyltransferase complex ATPase subunit type 1 TsaE [Candidatus Omnitrophota bacterium]
MIKHLISKNRSETINIGEKLGKIFRKGDIIALCGQLGSGKTVLTKGIAAGLGVKKSNYVNSPSFVILKEYKGRIPLYHFDIYRLNDISEFSTVGYSEYFYGRGVSVIEWADKIMDILPKEYLLISIEIVNENSRKLEIKACGEQYKKLLEKLNL